MDPIEIAKLIYPNNIAAQQALIQAMKAASTAQGLSGTGAGFEGMPFYQTQQGGNVFPTDPLSNFRSSPPADNLMDILGTPSGYPTSKMPIYQTQQGGNVFPTDPLTTDDTDFYGNSIQLGQGASSEDMARGLYPDPNIMTAEQLEQARISGKKALGSGAGVQNEDDEGDGGDKVGLSRNQLAMMSMMRDPSFYGGVGLENSLFTLGKSFAFDPKNFSPETQKRARRSNLIRGIGAAGKSLLNVGRLVGAGMGYSNRMNEFLSNYEGDKRDALVNNFQFEDGGEIDGKLFQYFKNGGTVEDMEIAKMLTGEYMSGLPKPQEGLANAEVEDGEYVKTDEGVQKVKGKTHEDGGVKVSLPGGTIIISDNLKVGKGYKECNEKYGIKAKPTDTYAKLIDRYSKKQGLDKLNKEQEKLFERVEKQKEISTASTRDLNVEFLSKRIEEIEVEKQSLLEDREAFTEYVFEKQENAKREKEEAAQRKMMEEQGISEEEQQMMMQQQGMQQQGMQQQGMSEEQMMQQQMMQQQGMQQQGMSEEQMMQMMQQQMMQQQGMPEGQGEEPQYKDGGVAPGKKNGETKRSWRKGKKMAVWMDGKWHHFGDSSMQDFRTHKSEKRKKAYYDRHKKNLKGNSSRAKAFRVYSKKTWRDGGKVGQSDLSMRYGISDDRLAEHVDMLARKYGATPEEMERYVEGLYYMSNGGEIPEWVETLLNYESTKGSASGGGVSNHGFTDPNAPGYKKDMTEEEAKEAFKKHYLSKVEKYPEELQPLLADYIFNTGRDLDNLLAYATAPDDTKLLQEVNTLDKDEFNEKYKSKLENAKQLIKENPSAFKDNLKQARHNIAKTSRTAKGARGTLQNPNPAYEKTWKGRIEMLAGASAPPTGGDVSTTTAAEAEAEREVFKFYENKFKKDKYAHQKQTRPDQGLNLYGDLKYDTLGNRLAETLRLFPGAAQFMTFDDDNNPTGFIDEAEGVGKFQTYVDNIYKNIYQYGAAEGFHPDLFGKKVESYRWDATGATPAKAFDKLFGDFTSSRSAVGLALVTDKELESLKGRNITHYSQLFDENGEVKEDLGLSDGTVKRVSGIKGKYKDDFDVFLLGTPTPKEEPTPEVVEVDNSTEEVPEKKDDEKKVVEEEETIEKEPMSIADIRGMMTAPVLPPQYALPPDGVQPHLMIDRTYQRLDPVKLSDEEHLKELFRQQSFATDQISQIPDSQRRATLATMTANTQEASNKVISDLAIQNAANFQQTEQFNISQADREEDARAADMLNFEQRQLTALEKTLENYNNYFKYNQDVRLGTYKDIQQMNFLSDLYDNFNVSGTGRIEFDPTTGMMITVDPMAGTEKKAIASGEDKSSKNKSG